ncbi:hypothetical protein SmJEL517_g01786 [Synchytrium microbalum]|uniref:Methyltransferase type 11 domain-containing protein n=1 Tax=Synchytrium microbalum TaxID=1806994 RepID=A0A507C988_9FUNG|nr:uncharacterized protein SmJEL517_g01786 [Synchytrium microbalum]TPX35918.1 hypothetical protein SmJEL517_g01786 [Synchytrium microbalum]
MSLPATLVDASQVGIEEEHVHSIYEKIAPHFSDTRYKPWPVVDAFLKDLPDGMCGLDIGCGNGKYMGVNPNIFIVGSDRSPSLCGIAASKGHSCVVADTLALPHPSSRFDFCLSIAVIHHLHTPERRLRAIKEMFRILKPGGKALIFVWALEQETKYRTFEGQDVLVPWNLPKRYGGARTLENAVADNVVLETDKIYQRYYHMFVKGELEGLITQACPDAILESGYQRDNWYCMATKVG